MLKGTGELYNVGTTTPPRDARGRFIPRATIATDPTRPLVVVDFPNAPAVPFHFGTGLLVKWSGEGGVRGEGAWHPTELVFDYDPTTHSLILTGGDYRSSGKFTVSWGGRLCRRLPITTTRGVTTQIVGVW